MNADLAERGVTKAVELRFAFPLPDGRWAVQTGTLHVVDGLTHKVSVAGLEARSGEAFGLTIAFYVVRNWSDDDGRQLGNIDRWVAENGVIYKIERVADLVELVAFDR